MLLRVVERDILHSGYILTVGLTEEQNRTVIQYYEKAAEEYDKEYDMTYFRKLYDRITWRYTEPYLLEKGVVLDVGGGTGKWKTQSKKIEEKGGKRRKH